MNPLLVSNKRFSDRFSWRLIPAIACGLLTTAVLAWSDCTQMYPDTDVVTELSVDAFRNCTLDAMVQRYASLVREQHQLLSALKPAYARKLEKMVGKGTISSEKRDLRLTEFDAGLSHLTTQQTALVIWITEPSIDPTTENALEKIQQRKSKLKVHLKTVKEARQTPNKRLQQAKGELSDTENNTFCKLDFKIRVSQKLNQMIAACLSEN